MGKIALFGGTFDPIHNGHIALAEKVCDDFALDRIIFIPAGIPPHKKNQDITDAVHRYQMVALATKDNPRFCVSDFELKSETPNYSYLTISHFKELFPDDEIFFLVGGDSFRDFPDWKCYRKLLSLCTFLVVPRPGVSGVQYLEKFQGDETPPRVHFLKNFACSISSTDIRKKLSDKTSVLSDVPLQVYDYILKNNLYIK